MKPYYDESGVTLYHGDCREILSAMPTVQLVVTDPPYRSLDIDVIRGTTTRLVGGHNARGGDRIGSGEWFETISDEDLSEILVGVFGDLPHTAAMYVFGDVKTGLRIFPQMQPSNVIVWDKMKIGMGYSWRRMHEWIAYCPKQNHKLRSAALGDIIRFAGVDDKWHPTEKPVGVLCPLICNSSDHGDTVLDPFAGICTTLTAAKLCGRRAIGIEKSERYCEIGANRLRQSVLFGASA